MQAAIGYGAAIAIAWGPLMGIIINTAKMFALLQGGIALLTGGGVVSGGLAALVAIVTGPVGIIAALVAAGVAVYVFRDQIGDAIAGLGDMWINAFEAIINFSRDIFNQIIQSFDSVVNTPFGIFLKALRGDWGGVLMSMAALALGQFKGIGDMIGSQLRSAFTSAASAVQGIWNGMLQGIRNAINSVFAGINKTINDWISGINSVIRAISSTTRVSLPQVPLVSIPRFATGAYVTGPTIAQVGEGGQPEYVIPSSRMASASAAYLGGARGVAVLNGSAPGGGRPVVNIQTGPVMQQADGSRWVSLDDAAAMVRQAVDQLRGELAQPSTRAALGVG
jgi:phage-related protein